MKHHRQVTSETSRLLELAESSNHLRKDLHKKTIKKTYSILPDSTSARKIILSGNVALNPEPENLKKHTKCKPQRKQSSRKHLSITHLNIQSVSSTCYEFEVIINENQFSIVTLSKTWLRNNIHLLDYMKILGYNFVYKNKE